MVSIGLPKLGVNCIVCVVASGVVCCCVVGWVWRLGADEAEWAEVVGTGGHKSYVGKSWGGEIVGSEGCGGGMWCECWSSVSRLSDSACMKVAGSGKGLLAQ